MKDTNNMQQELMSAPDLDRFLSENQDNFLSGNILELLNALFQKRSISKAALAKQSGMSEVYLHQVFAGRRNPSRSRLICLCFGLSATLDETQELLKQGGFAQLEVYEDCWHVFQQMPIPRATRALESASRFVQRIL